MDNTKLIIDTINDQLNKAHDQIKSSRELNLKILTIGLTICGTLLAYSLKHQYYQILLIVPYIILSVISYHLLLLSGIYSFAGYKEFLESKLNGILKVNFVKWEIVSKRYVRSKSISFLMISLYIIFFVSNIFILFDNIEKLSLIYRYMLYASSVLWTFYMIYIYITIKKILKLDKEVMSDLNNELL